jgi:hypothetical protein
VWGVAVPIKFASAVASNPLVYLRMDPSLLAAVSIPILRRCSAEFGPQDVQPFERQIVIAN